MRSATRHGAQGRGQSRRFVHRPSHDLGRTGGASVDLDPSSTGRLLRSAAAHGLVSLHHEGYDPDICWIGEVSQVSEKHVHLREIDPEGTWMTTVKHRRETLTRIDVGDLYNQALTVFAHEA